MDGYLELSPLVWEKDAHRASSVNLYPGVLLLPVSRCGSVQAGSVDYDPASESQIICNCLSLHKTEMMQKIVYLLHPSKSRVSDPLRSDTNCGATSGADQKLLTKEYDLIN